jgi:hypothetical protein
MDCIRNSSGSRPCGEVDNPAFPPPVTGELDDCQWVGWFAGKTIHSLRVVLPEKERLSKRAPGCLFGKMGLSRFWVGRKRPPISGGIKTEQLSDFSTIRALYPQF